LPKIGLLDRIERELDVIEPNLAFLLLGIVTGETVVFDKDAMLGVEHGLRRLGEKGKRSEKKRSVVAEHSWTGKRLGVKDGELMLKF
jgi:hypothetical protein